MDIPESYPCDICGDAVPQCETLIREDSCEGCWKGEHDGGVCSCCYGVICPKHTAEVTCPHVAADHDRS
jgi:hypothetical protein